MGASPLGAHSLQNGRIAACRQLWRRSESSDALEAPTIGRYSLGPVSRPSVASPEAVGNLCHQAKLASPGEPLSPHRVPLSSVQRGISAVNTQLHPQTLRRAVARLLD